MKRSNVYAYFENVEKEEFFENYFLLQENIKEKGFSFEGKEFPYSLKPLLISKDEETYFKTTSELLLEALEIVLENYYKDEYIRSFFNHYDRFKELLDIVQPGRKIAISRFDTVWYGKNDYRVFECNTCCPGGISILGTVKRDYKQLPIVKKLLESTDDFACDYTENFINSLVDYAQNILNDLTSTEKIGIAFGNYNNVYTYELWEFCQCAKSMGYNAVICDLKDLKQNQENGKLYYDDIEINIVYNKADPLMLDDKLIYDLLNAIKENKVVSINSFPAMYITESKIVLALLWDEYFQKKYLSSVHSLIVKKHVPCTVVLKDGQAKFKDCDVVDVISFSKLNRTSLVLKIDNDTRGNNIFIGHSIEQDVWDELIDINKNKNWIIQEYCEIPEIIIPEHEKNDGKLFFSKKKYGIDFMMYNGKYAGIVSRISAKEIINVGSGGCEQPVFVIKSNT